MSFSLSKFEEFSVDFNQLFVMSYSFDMLKNMMETLVRNQRYHEDKINSLLSKEMGNQYNSNNYSNEQRYNDTNQMNYLTRRIDDLERRMDEQKFRQEGNDGTRFENQASEASGKESETLMVIVNNLQRKIFFMESQIKNITYVERDCNDLKLSNKDVLNELEQLKLQMNSLSSNVDKTFQDINVRLEDLNFFDMLKSGKSEGNFTEKDEVLGVISALERKTLKKFEFVDEKSKKNEEDIYKLKSEVNNIKYLIDQSVKSLQQNQEKSDNKLTNLLEEAKNKIKDELELIDQKFKSLVKESNDINDKKIEETSFNLLKIINEVRELADQTKNNSKKGGQLEEDEVKLVHKKIAEIDKNLKLMNNSFNMDLVKFEISKVSETISLKAGIQDIFDLNDKINKISKQFDFLADTISALSDDKKLVNDDFVLLKKKFENLNKLVISGKNMEENTNNTGTNNKLFAIDINKFVDINNFNSFKDDVLKENHNQRLKIEELKRTIDDIIVTLNGKITEKELKSLETFFFSKIEEFKSACTKKFADKNEMNKNIKFLDVQIKQLMEFNSKRNEKNDNWLLAKKPIDGYTCASCESYIGNLQDNQNHIPWNKYPARDPQEKFYRVGNGFSRMLQMLNIESASNNLMIKTSKISNNMNEFNNTYTADHSSDVETSKNHKNLPKVKLNKEHFHTNPNISGDNLNEEKQGWDKINNSGDDEDRPKIVKIYKKNKII